MSQKTCENGKLFMTPFFSYGSPISLEISFSLIDQQVLVC